METLINKPIHDCYMVLPKTSYRPEVMDVVKVGKMFVIRTYSEIQKVYIIQAEHRTLEAAIQDCLNWYPINQS